jgi:Tfp pilus assembly protein PilO
MLRSAWAFYRQLHTRERRALGALAGGVALFLAAQFLLLPALDSAEQLQAALPLKEKTLKKYQDLAALVGTRESDWRNLQARLSEAEAGLLDSQTPALASAELQERLKQLASQQNIDLRGVEFMPVRPLKPAEAGYVAVPLSLVFECTLDQFAAFVGALAEAPKTLAIDHLSITAPPMRIEKQKKTITVRLTVHAVIAAEKS